MNQNLFSGYRRRLVRVSGLVLALSLVASPALAFQQVRHTGTVGHVFAEDTPDHPGAVCISFEDAMFDVRLRAIALMWPDNDASKREHGWARLRATLEEFDNSWHMFKKSPFVTRFVADDVKTGYPSVQIHIDVPDPDDYYRVGFIIKWYKANGELRGKSRYYVEYHQDQGRGGVFHRCDGGLY